MINLVLLRNMTDNELLNYFNGGYHDNEIVKLLLIRLENVINNMDDELGVLKDELSSTNDELIDARDEIEELNSQILSLEQQLENTDGE